MAMMCGLCKRPIRGDERYTTDHYQCSVDLTRSWRNDIDQAVARAEAADARASKLEDAAFHFQSCRACRKDGEDSCLDGRQFAAFMRGELDGD